MMTEQSYSPPPIPNNHHHHHNNHQIRAADQAPGSGQGADYLAQLIKDKKQLCAFPNVFLHAERLLDDEIQKVRVGLFHVNGGRKELILPEGTGPVSTLSEKLYVPVKEHPEFNFVGRILGPRGMTAKQLEQDLGCKIMVRGKGSMRDKKKEDQNRGKPNWEHLTDELHVLITVEDHENRARCKLDAAIDEIKKLLIPAPEGEDDLKKKQLMELAIINGTYRDSSLKPPGLAMHQRMQLAPHMMTAAHPALRGSPLGQPLIIQPRVPMHPHTPTLINGSVPPPLVAPGDASLLYSPYETYGYTTAAISPTFVDYAGVPTSLAAASSHVHNIHDAANTNQQLGAGMAGGGGKVGQQQTRRLREQHPYQR